VADREETAPALPPSAAPAAASHRDRAKAITAGQARKGDWSDRRRDMSGLYAKTVAVS
jgi:hypothetical protein